MWEFIKKIFSYFFSSKKKEHKEEVLTIEEVMVSLENISKIYSDSSPEDVTRCFISSKRSILPVYKEDVDNIIGSYDIYSQLQNKGLNLNKLKDVIYLPFNTSVQNALSVIFKSNTGLCVVVDEYGGTQGFLYPEKILEFFINNNEENNNSVYFQKDGSLIVSSNIELQDLFNLINIPEFNNNQNTINQYVLSKILNGSSSLAEKGRSFIEHNYKFTIYSMDKKAIKKIKISEINNK